MTLNDDFTSVVLRKLFISIVLLFLLLSFVAAKKVMIYPSPSRFHYLIPIQSKNNCLKMCTNTRLVHNRYTGKMIRVSCGKCPACLQKKAALRANRIRANYREGQIALFVTLTYDNAFVPYIKRSELGSERLNIYRDSTVRFYRGKMIVKYSPCILGTVEIPRYVDYFGLKDLKGKPDCIGVIHLKDVQDFIKRLRINYFRIYETQLNLSYFACHEYGGRGYRPHSHLLLYIRRDDAEKVKCIISSSWSFDFRNPKRFRIEVARNAASYVASYVNSGDNFPSLLQTDSFRQRCHFSQSFGVGLPCFSLKEILEKAYRGDLSYNRRTFKNGVPELNSVPLPQYVIHRYFPKFKGYCRFVDSEILSLLRVPYQVQYKLVRGSKMEFSYGKTRYVIDDTYNATKTDFKDSDFHAFVVRLRHCLDYYISVTGKNEFDFAIDYNLVWRSFYSSVLKYSYFDDKGFPITDFSNFYENINEVDTGVVSAPTLSVDSSFVRDPNERSDIVLQSSNLENIYSKMCKNKNVVNYALSELGFNV